MKEIGVRAAKEIYNRQDCEHGIDDLLDEIELTKTSLWQYRTGKYTPSGVILRRMALAGYDVIYILTGERK
jgi:hypothetical protein